MEPIVLFFASGIVSMSAALSAGNLSKLPPEQREGWLAKENGPVIAIMLGNIAALTLLAAMAYGVSNLGWALPLGCLVVSFPLVHVLLLQRLFGDMRNLMLMGGPTIAAACALYYYW